MTLSNLNLNLEKHDVLENPPSMNAEQFARLIGAIETQSKMVEKIGKKLNTFIDIVYFMTFLSIVAAGCSLIGLL